MSAAGTRVALLGATGAVGGEILRALAERALPLAELRLFASQASEGSRLEFRDEDLRVEALHGAEDLAGCDLVLCAAPAVLEPLLADLGPRGPALVDVSGALELDSGVPLYLPGRSARGPRVAVPRGVVTGLALALTPLLDETGLQRVTVTTLESASGAGRRGLDELQGQVLRTLSALDGEAGEASVFPQPLAFDCLPRIGEISDAAETSEEQRLRQVLRRALERPELPVEVTRIQVPVFTGALATVHAQLEKPLHLDRVRELWRAAPALRVLSDPELPTPRGALPHDAVSIGRARLDEGGTRLGFALALDPQRRGAALGVVEAAEQLLAE